MSGDRQWRLLGMKWGYVQDWSPAQALTMAVIAGVTIAQGKPWSYLGWTIVVFAVATRAQGQKSLLEQAVGIL